MTISPLPQGHNRRASPRKVIRRPATVIVGDVGTQVQTWDLGRDGMCLLAPRPIAPGTRCRIVFDIPLGGGVCAVTATAKAVYSSYSAPGEFKIGTVFLDLDENLATTLGNFAATP
ncbi:MAG: PilZ domain-containing protein [Caldimonas sp.]